MKIIWKFLTKLITWKGFKHDMMWFLCDSISITQQHIVHTHEWVDVFRFFGFCLGFIDPFENFSARWRHNPYREGLQILTNARHSWPLSSEGYSACHTFCDTGHPFSMVIFEDPWHSHLLLSVYQWSCHYLFLRIRSVAAGIRTPNLPLAGPTLNCATAAVMGKWSDRMG